MTDDFDSSGIRPAKTILLAAAFLGPTLFALGLSMTPDLRGHGTHEQLGMAPCGFPPRYGIPCPTCGVTTSFAYAARLDLVGAVETQLFGTFLFVALQTISVASVVCLLKGRTPTIPRPLSHRGLLILAGITAILLFAWWLKIQTWRW